jgi:hypothetical protein
MQCCPPYEEGISADRTNEIADVQVLRSKGMLGIIVAVIFVLWLIGFLAFHLTAAFIRKKRDRREADSSRKPHHIEAADFEGIGWRQRPVERGVLCLEEEQK